MYVGASVAAVTLAEAVVVHAELLLLLLLASVSDYGEAPLNRTASFKKQKKKHNRNHRYPQINTTTC